MTVPTVNTVITDSFFDVASCRHPVAVKMSTGRNGRALRGSCGWWRRWSHAVQLSQSAYAGVRSRHENAPKCTVRLLEDVSKLLKKLVGAGRFERPTPCAQGRCATGLRYAPTLKLLLSF